MCNDKVSEVNDPSHRLTLVPDWDGNIQRLQIQSGFFYPDICRYKIRFPTDATFGDKLLIKGTRAVEVFSYVSVGEEFNNEMQSHQFENTYIIEVSYPNNVYIVITHQTLQPRQGEFEIEYSFSRSANQEEIDESIQEYKEQDKKPKVVVINGEEIVTEGKCT